MSLINCPDCGTDVSSLAAACPKCARPIASQPQPGLPDVQPIEQTGKQFKRQYLVYKVLLIVGFILAGISLIALRGADHGAAAISGLLAIPLMLIAAVAGIILQIRTWWHHG